MEIIKDKIYKALYKDSYIFVKAIEDNSPRSFSGVCIFSTNTYYKIGHYSNTWNKTQFTECDDFVGSNELFPIY